MFFIIKRFWIKVRFFIKINFGMVSFIIVVYYLKVVILWGNYIYVLELIFYYFIEFIKYLFKIF